MTSYEYPSERGKHRGLPIVGAKPRLFQVIRNIDGKEISGTGHIIDGVIFGDGTVVIQWQGDYKSVSVFKSLNDFLAVHVKPKYQGENEFRWFEGYKPSEDVGEVCRTIKDFALRLDGLSKKQRAAIIALATGIERKYEEVV